MGQSISLYWAVASSAMEQIKMIRIDLTANGSYCRIWALQKMDYIGFARKEYWATVEESFGEIYWLLIRIECFKECAVMLMYRRQADTLMNQTENFKHTRHDLDTKDVPHPLQPELYILWSVTTLCLTYSIQRMSINGPYPVWQNITSVVPQGSVLWPQF